VWTSYEFGVVGAVVVGGATADALANMNGAVAGERRRLEESNVATLIRLAADDSTTLIVVDGTTIETTNGHWSADWAFAGNMNVRFGGAIEGALANDKVSYVDAVPIGIGARTATAGGPCNCALQAWYFSTAQLTADERTYLRALLTYHTGITC
jgi:hypothetical protein